MSMTARTLGRIAGIAAASLACVAGSAQAVTVHDATADFSAVSNANGVWSYGYETSLGGSFTLYTHAEPSLDPGVTGSADGWNAGAGLLPWVAKAGPSGWDCCTSSGTTAHAAAGTLTLHPGPMTEYSVVRFTAPTAGSYAIAASFWGQDDGTNSGGQRPGTTTDVHVRLASGDLFTGAVNGFGPSTTTSGGGTVSLAAGETVDFVVGVGANGNYYNDSTGLAATVTAVPEPETVAMMLAGLGALAFVARRRDAR